MARELTKNRQGSGNTAYSPFGMMRRFTDDVDRWFDRWSPWGWGNEHRFSPELEILERDGKLIVRADLPGLNKEDVHVDVSENSLTIEGERKCEHEKTEEGIYTCERSYGHFRREIALPDGVKTDSAKANFKNGILEITFDAPDTAKNRRRLQIKEEAA